MKWYLLHPAVVHFPIALLLAGFAGCVLALFKKAPAWFEPAVSWLLWLGSASAWIAVGLGELAEKTAPHVPMAPIEAHSNLGWTTAWIFTGLGVWRRIAEKKARALFCLLWLAGCLVLLTTAYRGGDLVFQWNFGTAASVEP